MYFYKNMVLQAKREIIHSKNTVNIQRSQGHAHRTTDNFIMQYGAVVPKIQAQFDRGNN